MPTYTVHEPPPRKTESVTAPERFVFVRDGFHFWAFVLAPVWLLVRKLWLAFFIYVVVMIAVVIGLRFAGAPSWVQVTAEFAIALLIGFEASTIRRWTLTRRRWKNLGFVVAEDAEIAERRFYGAWTERAPLAPTPPEPSYATPVRRGAPSPSDVIGLFPEPGNSSIGTPR
ncbi:MAG: DUF2628 domain-containing protein [Pseudolabrys sp.]|nr:DUF2628 domain-containing protein [Pseudolabrys sp.]MDP2297529.1 DUF2628 domain-containing protein [Pseudolabrys sp.]